MIFASLVEFQDYIKFTKSVTNFIWTYLHQFFDNFYSINRARKPLWRHFGQYQICLKEINIGQAIRKISR